MFDVADSDDGFELWWWSPIEGNMQKRLVLLIDVLHLIEI